jgi:hypothetical protein
MSTPDRSVVPPAGLVKAAGKAPLRVYLVLAARCNAAGQCWPGLSRIATDADLHRGTVTRALTWLEAEGWITRDRRTDDEAGGHRSTLYTLPAEVRTTTAQNSDPLVASTRLPSRGHATTPSRASATPLVAPARPEHLSGNTSQPNTSSVVASGATADPVAVIPTNLEAVTPFDRVFARLPNAGWAQEVIKLVKRTTGAGIPEPDALDLAATLVVEVLETAKTRPEMVPDTDRASLLAQLGPLIKLSQTDGEASVRHRWHLHLVHTAAGTSHPVAIARTIVRNWDTYPGTAARNTAQTTAASRQTAHLRAQHEKTTTP